jgi:hypothetical protein
MWRHGHYYSTIGSTNTVHLGYTEFRKNFFKYVYTIHNCIVYAFILLEAWGVCLPQHHYKHLSNELFLSNSFLMYTTSLGNRDFFQFHYTFTSHCCIWGPLLIQISLCRTWLLYVANLRAYKNIKLILTDQKRETDSNTIIVRYFNTPLSIMNRPFWQKSYKLVLRRTL